MSYEPYYPGGWQSGESGGTPITPEALNHMEKGIEQCAPAGYGLGGPGKATENLDTALNCGWYSFGINCANAPFNYGVALVFNRYGTGYVQIAFDTAMSTSSYNGAIAKRVMLQNSGTWDEWEYVNPPMVTNKEYRTIERWKGEPVYTKLIDFGAMPNATSKTVFTGLAAEKVVSLEGFVLSGSGTFKTFPYISEDGIIAARCYIGSTGALGVVTTTDMSECTAQFVIKYTK